MNKTEDGVPSVCLQIVGKKQYGKQYGNACTDYCGKTYKGNIQGVMTENGRQEG